MYTNEVQLYINKTPVMIDFKQKLFFPFSNLIPIIDFF